MIGYAEAFIFDPTAIDIFHRATAFVALLDGPFDETIRCHELARAVATVLNLPDLGIRSLVLDGKLGVLEHSWIQLSCKTPDGCTPVGLEVYAPGRLPLVQLVDMSSYLVPGLNSRDYKVCGERTDINWALVEQLVAKMRSATR